MNAELQKIDTYLSGHGFYKKAYFELSKDKHGHPLVSSTTIEAYCYDDVSSHFFRIKTASADAIVLKDSLYFIEFKSIRSCDRDADKYKIIKQNLFLKLGESLFLLNKYLNPSAGATCNYKKYFIIVVNSISSPTTAMAGSMSGLARGACSPTSFSAVFGKYRQWFNGSPVFYDDVMVWNDINFSAEVCRLR